MQTFRQDYPLESGNAVRLMAQGVRRERTGVHAEISILMNSVVLAKDEFNISRHKERVSLANAAHKRLEKIDAQLWPPERMLDALTAFTDGLWDAHLSAMSAKPLTGGYEPSPVSFWIEPFIIQGGGTILFAPKGAGKTYLALVMERCLTHGLNQFWPVTQSSVLFVQLERSSETFGRRVTQINRALGIKPNDTVFTLVARGKSLFDVIDVIRRHVEQDGVQLVIVDSISRSGAGGLVEDRTANTVMDALNAAAPSWLALGHTSHEGKDDPSKAHLFGSVMFENASDVMVQMVTQKKRDEQTKATTMGVMLKVTDANDIPSGFTSILALDFDPKLGLQSIRKSTRAEFPELVAGETFGRTDKVAMYIEETGLASATAIAAAIGEKRTTVTSILREDRRFAVVKKEGKEVLYGLRTEREGT